MDKKLYNSIGFFCYGSEAKGHLFEILGLCLLVSINGKPLLIVNKLLLDRVPNQFIPKFIFKTHDDNSGHTINTFRIRKQQFTSHFSDSNCSTFNIAIAPPSIGSEKFDLIDLPLDFQPPILLNHEELIVATVPKHDFNKEFFSNRSSIYIELLDGKIFTNREDINLNENKKFKRQSIVNINPSEKKKLEIDSHFYSGSLAFINCNNTLIPLGIVNAAIRGRNNRFINHFSHSNLYLALTDFHKIFQILHHSLGNNFSRNYKNAAEYYSDKIDLLRDEIERIIDENISAQLKTLKRSNFDKVLVKHISERMRAIRGELLSFRFNLFMLEQNLLDKEWWDFVHKNNIPNAHQKRGLISHFDRTIVRSFTIGFFSVMEHILRDTLRKIDEKAVDNARGNFSKVYKYYLERLKVDDKLRDEFEKLLKILSHIRNSIHNDGHIFRKYDKNKIIEINYKGTDYKFEDGKGLSFDLETYIYLSEEVVDFLWTLLKDKYVTKGFLKNP